MIRRIYLEQAVRDHPRSQHIVQRHPRAQVIECAHYGELVNRAGQHFRLQKQQPALVLARKQGRAVLPTPAAYGLGAEHNYYFSHMLNCLYDCRYCFLQGMYRSAHYVLFINYEEIAEQVRAIAAGHGGEPCWFFSGYDCDSLALEPLTGFAEFFLPVFEDLPGAWLELRTKSTQVRTLLARPPMPNVVVAFSFTTEEAGEALEHKVPTLARRIEAMAALQAHGWPVAVRFDPVIGHEGFDEAFAALCAQIFQRVDAAAVHSACIGAFRLPRDFYKRIRKLYPAEPLFARRLVDRDGMVGYREAREQALLASALEQVAGYLPRTRIFRMDAA